MLLLTKIFLKQIVFVSQVYHCIDNISLHAVLIFIFKPQFWPPSVVVVSGHLIVFFWEYGHHPYIQAIETFIYDRIYAGKLSFFQYFRDYYFVLSLDIQYFAKIFQVDIEFFPVLSIMSRSLSYREECSVYKLNKP